MKFSINRIRIQAGKGIAAIYFAHDIGESYEYHLIKSYEIRFA